MTAEDGFVYKIGQWREYLEHTGGRPLAIEALDPDRSALVVVDVQRKMVDRKIDPRLRLRDMRPDRAQQEEDRWRRIDDVVVPNIVQLLGQFRSDNRVVLHFAAGPQMPKAEDLPLSYRLLVQPGIDRTGSAVHWASPEYAFASAVEPMADEFVIRKRTRSGFTHTETENLLHSLGITDLVMVGGATEACVESTARAAADCGFKVVVVEDAVIPGTPLNQDASMIAIACFIGAVRTTEEVLNEMKARGT